MNMECKGNADTGPAEADNTGNHSAGERPVSRVRPIPEACRNVQVNFCNAPGCPNLCVQPLLGRIRTGWSNESDGYRVSGAGTESALLCTYCGVESRIKSNQAIHEEAQRQAAHIFAPSPLVCPQGCQSGPRHPTKAYQRFGKSDAGSLRFRFRSCKATFSIPGPTARQRRARANTPVFARITS